MLFASLMKSLSSPDSGYYLSKAEEWIPSVLSSDNSFKNLYLENHLTEKLPPVHDESKTTHKQK